MSVENQNEQILNAEKLALFDAAYQKALTNPGGFIEYTFPYPKHEFLEFLVNMKGVLLHGSNYPDIHELEPRQANCKSKKFGNLKAVYATEDEILPIFHAVQDKTKMHDVAMSSGYSDEGGVKTYNFGIDKQEVLDSYPWSGGVIYILPRAIFEQGTDDEGHPIDEFISRVPVSAIAKLRVAPEDFPYINQVVIKNEK